MSDFNVDEPPAGGDPDERSEDLTTHVPPRGGDGWHEGFDFDAPPVS